MSCLESVRNLGEFRASLSCEEDVVQSHDMRAMLECFVTRTSQGRVVSHGSQPLCGVNDMVRDSKVGALKARPHHV